MKRIGFLLLLAGSFAAHAQSSDPCSDAQNLYNQGKFNEAIRSVGLGLTKNPANSDCRKIRINAAMQESPTAQMYVIALTDLGYLVDHGDKSEWTYERVAVAESGLAAQLYQVRDYANALKHYGVAKEALQKAKGVAGSEGSAKYNKRIEDADTYLMQVQAEMKP